MRTWLQKGLRAYLFKNLVPVTPAELKRSALIFAPHPDDETLGCGGTIIQKRTAGADARLVVMTDGSSSHQMFLPREKLVELRRQEVFKAAEVLGISKDKVTLLNFPDGQLEGHQQPALAKVIQLLEGFSPEEVYIPHHLDQVGDHITTNSLVLSALKASKHSVTVYEYPVWFWYHWPWVGISKQRGQGSSVIFKNSLAFRFGLCSLYEFRSRVNIEKVLGRKHVALEQHRSQVARLEPTPEWKILADVAQGDFLACFFQPWEVFRSYAIHAG